jgi:SRSO17 transposase
MVKDDLGHPSSAIIFDETGFVKKGKESIGASKQYCGTLGKVDNCQVGVFALYASPYGNALIDKRLYLPQL